MGDARFNRHLQRVQDAREPARVLREMEDEAVVAALAAASREADPYLANVLATEAMNRMRRNAAIVRLAGEGLFALDGQGCVTYMNPAAEALLGWSFAELVGRPMHEVVHYQDAQGAHVPLEACALHRALREGVPVRVEEDVFTRKDGERVSVSLAGTPILQDGEVVGVVVAMSDVRARNEAQVRLLALKEQVDAQARTLHAILEGTPDVVYVLDEEGRYLHVNRAGAAVLGRPAGDVLNRTWRELGLPAEVMEPFMARVGEALRRSGPQRGTLAFTGAFGPREYEYALAPLPSPDGAPLRVVVISRDVTERHRLHRALEESEARFRSLYENIPSMYFRVGLEGAILSANRFGAEHLGYEPVDLVGRNVMDLFHPADRESFLRGFHEVVHGPRGYGRFRFRKLTRRGRVVWVDESMRLSTDPDGTRVLLVTCNDVTSERRAQELSEGQARILERIASGAPLRDVLDELARLMESVSDGMLASILLVDAAAGVLRDAAGPSLPAEYRRALDGMRYGPNAGSCGAAAHAGAPVVVPDIRTDERWGEHRDLAEAHGLRACWSTPIVSSDGVVLGTFAMYYRDPRHPEEDDVALARLAVHLARVAIERDRHERAVKEWASRVEGILESITDSFFALDRDWRFVYLNRQAERVLRRRREELLGRLLWEEFPDSASTEFEAHYRQAVAQDAPVHFEAFYRPLNIWFEVHAFPTPDRGLSVYFRDVTHRRRTEEAIRQLNAELEARVRRRTRELAEANRELESFSYSISHDLRGPLRGIDYFAQLLEDEQGPRLDEEGRRHLQMLRAEARRLGEHVAGILEVSRASRGPLDRERVDVTALARDVAERLRREAPDREVSFEVQPGMVADAEPRLLRSVFENLLGNAWKFTGRTQAARIEVFAEKDAEGRTVYAVRDNGAGFDMAKAAGLFRSFERLHARSEFEGTGIGLATVKRIVERHGGRVWAEGAPGKGATFRFTLA